MEMNIPANLLTVLKNGTMKGSWLSKSRTFQSKVGNGLTPRPVLKPVIVVKLTFLGAIQVIQLKADRAVKM